MFVADVMLWTPLILRYPSDSVLLASYRRQAAWNQYKSHVVREVLAPRRHLLPDAPADRKLGADARLVDTLRRCVTFRGPDLRSNYKTNCAMRCGAVCHIG